MKCKNCNWPNRPGEKKCIKCGAPLTDTPSPSAPLPPFGGNGLDSNRTVVNFGANPQPSPAPRVNQQAPYTAQPTPQAAPQAAPPAPAANICPRCSYPLRSGMTVCPNCSYQLQPSPAAPYPPATGASPTPSPMPAVGTNNPMPSVAPLTPPPGTQEAVAQRQQRATVNVYTASNAGAAPSFSLTPVKKINEPMQPEPLEFAGREAILNRANTDPDNLSITSRQQASISNVNGKWVITDMSDQKTTFVHPSPGHELKDGDMILMGNRLFIFHA